MSDGSIKSPLQNNNKGRRPHNFGPFGVDTPGGGLDAKVVNVGQPSKPKKLKAAVGEAQAQLSFKEGRKKPKEESRIPPPPVKAAVKNEGSSTAVGQGGDHLLDEQEPEKPITVILRSTNEHDEGVTYTLAAQDTFRAVYLNYAYLLDTSKEKIVVMKGQKVVDENMTAVENGVDDGDALYVHPVGSYINKDTTVKEIIVRHCNNDPVQLNVRAPLQQTLDDVQTLWANFMKWDKKTFYLVKNDAHMETEGTISSEGVENGDIFFCVPVKKSTNNTTSLQF